ncbi:MAG: hypothetical protein M3N23_11370 [Pseudomonadota bacterium]|nr:hypothetical protein [Pseudomonadota bacterium]
MDAQAVFQRTESGRTEIKTKMHGLTQSERLALIVVDGVSPYTELRNKLKGLASDRFERALNNLVKKNLIFEVLLPQGDVEEEAFDSETVDRFLQQDPLDPVTIISFDPEDEFGLGDIDADAGAEAAGVASGEHDSDHGADNVPATATAGAGLAVSSASPTVQPTPSQGAEAARSRIVTVDIYLPLEPRVGRATAEAMQGHSATVGTPASSTHNVQYAHQTAPLAFSRPAAPIFAPTGGKPQWGQLLIAAGIVLIVLSILVKLLH